MEQTVQVTLKNHALQWNIHSSVCLIFNFSEPAYKIFSNELKEFSIMSQNVAQEF